MDKEKFERACKKDYKKFYYLALKTVKNKEEAEDVVTEAFFRGYKALHTYEGDRPFVNWMMRIVSRLALDSIRHKNRRISYASYDNPIDCGEDTVMAEFNSPELPVDYVVLEKMEPYHEEVFKDLPEIYKEVAVMIWVQDMHYVEVAEVLGIPEGTVRSRIHRARNLIEHKFKVGEAA